MTVRYPRRAASHNGTAKSITNLRVTLRGLYFIKRNGEKVEEIISDTNREFSQVEYFSNGVMLPRREGLVYIAEVQREKIFFLLKVPFPYEASGWDTMANNTTMEENFEIALQVDAMVDDLPIHRDFRANIKFDVHGDNSEFDVNIGEWKYLGVSKVISRVYVKEIKNESKATDPIGQPSPR